MTEKFKSKIGLGIIIPIALILIAVLIFMLIEEAWAGVVILVCVGAFILYMFTTTYYTIAGNELKVRSGFMINITIDINTITKITPTNNMLSAPALSLDRLEIFYNKYDSVVISPGDKARFIAELKAVNERILSPPIP